MLTRSDETPPAEYSIGVTARLTGVSTDKLRMWERRYGFPKPRRTPTGVRVYSEEDVNRLILVERALQAGCRAGEAIRKTNEELRALVERTITPATPALSDAVVTPAELIRLLQRDDTDGIRLALRQAVASLGPKQFVIQLAAPLIEQVGIAWERGQLQVRHEHHMSEILITQTRLLLSAYEHATGPVLLLATLPGELHGLGLEMVALYAAAEGIRPRLLGTDTPVDQIVDAARALGAHAVGITVARGYDMVKARGAVERLLERLPKRSALWVGGALAEHVRFDDSSFSIVGSWDDLDRLIGVLKTRG